MLLAVDRPTVCVSEEEESAEAASGLAKAESLTYPTITEWAEARRDLWNALLAAAVRVGVDVRVCRELPYTPIWACSSDPMVACWSRVRLGTYDGRTYRPGKVRILPDFQASAPCGLPSPVILLHEIAHAVVGVDEDATVLWETDAFCQLVVGLPQHIQASCHEALATYQDGAASTSAMEAMRQQWISAGADLSLGWSLRLNPKPPRKASP